MKYDDETKPFFLAYYSGLAMQSFLQLVGSKAGIEDLEKIPHMSIDLAKDMVKELEKELGNDIWSNES